MLVWGGVGVIYDLPLPLISLHCSLCFLFTCVHFNICRWILINLIWFDLVFKHGAIFGNSSLTRRHTWGSQWMVPLRQRYHFRRPWVTSTQYYKVAQRASKVTLPDWWITRSCTYLSQSEDRSLSGSCNRTNSTKEVRLVVRLCWLAEHEDLRVDFAPIDFGLISATFAARQKWKLKLIPVERLGLVTTVNPHHQLPVCHEGCLAKIGLVSQKSHINTRRWTGQGIGTIQLNCVEKTAAGKNKGSWKIRT